MTETVAVIVATRNRAELVERLARRVVAMPGAPDELLVVDDGSHDDTAERLRAIVGVTLLPGTGRGAAHARNTAAATTTADWLVFLDDDDVPEDAWLTVLRDLIRDNPAARWVSIGCRRDLEGNVRVYRPRALGRAFSGAVASYLAGTFAVRRELFQQAGGFDDRLRHMEFTDLAVRAFACCASDATAYASDPEPRLTVIDRPPSQRQSQNPSVLANSALLVLDKTADFWRRDPSEHANQLATVGVALVRAGRDREAASCFRRAFALEPIRPRNLGRCIAVHVRPLRRRLWPAPPPPVAPSDAHRDVLASIVIPTYGRSELLAHAVRSALEQTHPSIEVLVVDDGSPEPIEPFDDPRVRVIRQENQGVSVARNTGASAALGEILLFLDDDDVFRPERVARAVRVHAWSRADIVVCGQAWLDGSSPLVHDLQGFVVDRVLDHTTPHVGATSVLRARFLPFDARYRASQDVEWWLRSAEECSVTSVPEVDYLVRRHGASRFGNGPAARVEFGFQLLEDHRAYFDAHPKARAFRYARIARLSLDLGDSSTAWACAVESVRTRIGRAGVAILLRTVLVRVRRRS